MASVICCNCEADCTRRYFMCEEDDGQWCPECWEKTACCAGVHGEGCPTLVMGDVDPTENAERRTETAVLSHSADSEGKSDA